MSDKPAPAKLTPEQERARQEAIRALAVLLAMEFTGTNHDDAPAIETAPNPKRRNAFSDHWNRVRTGTAAGRAGEEKRAARRNKPEPETAPPPPPAPMTIRPSPPSLMTSTQPFLHCCETWHVLAADGKRIANRPKQQATWDAIAGMQRDLLTPLEERYGVVTLTYGFAGPELVKAVMKRAEEGGWLPNITPSGDQHAGHELNTHGNPICKRGGIAVDLRVPGVSSHEVSDWVIQNLPFDRIYLYSPEQRTSSPRPHPPTFLEIPARPPRPISRRAPALRFSRPARPSTSPA